HFLYQGRSYDSVLAAPSDPAASAELLARLDEAVRCQADFIIVTTDLDQYSNAASPLLLFRSGRPMGERLLARVSDRSMAPMEVAHNSPIALLDNRGRPACARPNSAEH